jgi:hypothetical protein
VSAIREAIDRALAKANREYEDALAKLPEADRGRVRAIHEEERRAVRDLMLFGNAEVTPEAAMRMLLHYKDTAVSAKPRDPG